MQVIETADAVEIIIWPFVEVHREPVCKLIDKYVGFWRTIGCITVKHTREPAKAHWVVPVKHLIGADLTPEALEWVLGRVGGRIVVPNHSRR